ncbi:hypothetical protein MTO96_009866 [Rhipicephalus appendiculatus]
MGVGEDRQVGILLSAVAFISCYTMSDTPSGFSRSPWQDVINTGLRLRDAEGLSLSRSADHERLGLSWETEPTPGYNMARLLDVTNLASVLSQPSVTGMRESRRVY